jgi:two-component system, OmpR family, phosphate regulon sensor histidine kinase PhoR
MTAPQRVAGATSKLRPEELAEILDRLPAGVVVVDRHGAVRYANTAAQRHLHPARIRIGEPLPGVAADRPLEELTEQLFRQRVLGDESVRIGDETFAVAGAVDRNEVLASLVIEDVTTGVRRRRSEEDFAVNASHEILGPVAAIAGAAQVLQDGAKDDPQARDRFLTHISDASDRLTSIATALLVLARAESGLGGPRLELVPVRPILEDVARGMDDVTVSCSEKFGVLADADLFRQAVTMLVENARRHSQEGVGITVAEAGQMVAVDVLDRGAGILPENLERVTERFFSGAGRDSGGYGIGLSIAVRAAEALGGALELASDRTGTRARLKLPSARLL